MVLQRLHQVETRQLVQKVIRLTSGSGTPDPFLVQQSRTKFAVSSVEGDQSIFCETRAVQSQIQTASISTMPCDVDADHIIEDWGRTMDTILAHNWCGPRSYPCP